MSETADAKKDAKTDAKAKAKPKGGKSKLLLIIGLVVFLLAGGGGGYWWFVVKPAAAAAAAAAATPEGAEAAAKKKRSHEGGAAVKFDAFVVNLSDGGGSRFLRVGLSLVIAGDEAEAKHLEESKVALLRIRSQVIELLAQQTSEHVVTPEGKAELKTRIAEIATEILEPVEVLDVLFTEFVVQF